MAEQPVTMKDSVTVIEEIESKLERLLSRRKEEIETELEERIRVEKAEADKKIDAIQKEIDKGRSILDDYRSVISEFESERTSLQSQIKDHFDKAVSFQTEIEKMAGLTLEELRFVSELNRKLDGLHQSAEEKIGTFRKDIEDRFGIVAQLPAETAEEREMKIDLEQELNKLRKIKELLEAEGLGCEDLPDLMSVSPEPAVEPEAPAAVPEPDGPVNVPEINQVIEAALSGEAGVPEASEVQPEPAAPAEDRETFQSLFETLEKYRKIEPRNGNGEISFFTKDGKVILDGEHMIASIDESLEEAKRLYAKLTQTESPKEQFFIKQEIINYQEILRKNILRNVKLCEKEGAFLPGYTAEVLNLDMLKDILEKLSIENWSNPAEFNNFRAAIESLKDAYYARITPPSFYLKSLIEELGA